MKDNKRTKSISRRINLDLFLRLFSSFLLIDILLAVLSVSIWCWSAETSEKDSFSLSSHRGFSSLASLEKEELLTEDDEAFRDFKRSSLSEISPVFPRSFRALLSESFYVFEDDKGDSFCVYSGTFLLNLFSCLYVIAFVELLILAGVFIWGAGKVRRHLAPLDELAFKAQFFGDTADFDQQALHELESAVNSVSPMKDGAHVNTGNAEMENLESSINSLLDRIRAGYRQQSRFVSDASHELRTPIAVLQGYVSMLDRWGKDDEKILEESIEAIKSETQHMNRLVEQLLFLARGDSGRTKLHMENISLNEIIEEVYEESSMIDKDHKYIFRPCKEALTIKGDSAMLKQTARILAENAAKYTPSGGSIILSAFLKNKGGESCPAFAVEDEGMGINGEDISHIFERFFRSDPARGKDSGGTGLGLSIAKWIVDRHGGYFDVLTSEGIGTRITVMLPQKKAAGGRPTAPAHT